LYNRIIQPESGYNPAMTQFRVEFHCHTIASKDSLTRPEDLVAAARRKGLDRVVITDHNSIRGAHAAHALDPTLIIVGEEIMTTRGEILAAYVQEEIPPGLSPLETITSLRQQGAFVSVSHPFDRQREGGWKENDLLEILPLVDAIEVFNSRCMRKSYNSRALAFAQEHGLAGTVGSDAHAAFELGRSVMRLDPFMGANELIRVIRSGHAETRWSPPWFHVTSRYASLRKKIRIGLDITL
jgi:predicted metal-dependent phosphoesterase TrpH